MADDGKSTLEELEGKIESVFEKTKGALHHAAEKANEFVHLAMTAEALPDTVECEPILDEEDRVKMGLEWPHAKEQTETVGDESPNVSPPVEYDELFKRNSAS
uniref:Uncharacterized protein n=2 Tax=Plectus sambesii TaxID=2011161 RepID=A0A914VUD2_9BILA